MNDMNPAPKNEPMPRPGSWMERATRKAQEGRWGYALAWLLGVPLPILLIVYLLRGCQ